MVRVGRQLSPSKHSGQFPTKYLRAGNIKMDGLDLSDVLEMDFTPEERHTFGLRVGDIVVAEASGSASHVGRAAIWHGEIPDCCYQNTVIRFRPYAAISEYALIVFRHFAKSGLFAKLARGVGIQHLGSSRLAQLRFPLPPLNEQHRIVLEFGKRAAAAREAEASLQSALRHLDEQDQEILAAAASGKLSVSSGRRHRQGGKRRPDGPVRATKQGSLFDGKDVDAPPVEGLYPLPSGWLWIRVDQAGEVKGGKALSPHQQSGAPVRKYLRVANVLEDRLDTTDLNRMVFTKREYELYRLRPGDILLNEGQSPELVGRPALYRGEVPGACFQNSLIRFRAFSRTDPEYALLVFRHYLDASEFRKIARWSTNIAHLGVQRFAAMPFPLPPLNEQRRLAKEARKRLNASGTQREAVRSSLVGLREIDVELLSVATSGMLVGQDDSDESAPLLLKRLGSPRDERPAADRGESERQEQEDNTMTIDLGEVSRMIGRSRKLGPVLHEAKRPMRLPELFSKAGYDANSTEDIEQFYLALRAELQRSIRAVPGSSDNSLVEAVTDAPR
jgi:type I restriction enzyme S subunit